MRSVLAEMSDQKRRGGPGRNQGRKAKDGAVGLIRTNVLLTEAQRERLKGLGGSVWIRVQIDRGGQIMSEKESVSASRDKGRRGFYALGATLPGEVNEAAYICGLIDRFNEGRRDATLKRWLVSNGHASETADGWLV